MAKIPKPPVRGVAEAKFLETNPIAWSNGAEFREGKVAIGGSPWQITLIPREMRAFASRLFTAGRKGITARTDADKAAALFLLELGIADPLPVDDYLASDVEIVVPAYCDADVLETSLASLIGEGLPITVVDDASPEPHASAIRDVADSYGVKLIVREQNGGPGGARNTGIENTTAPFIAFADSDILGSAGWVHRLRPIFDDPLVGALGPRVRPALKGSSMIDLYEETRSELDMGEVPALVTYGGPAGWLPSASIMVRRAALCEPAFEPGLRVGEDVDLFWKMEEAGWHVRYVPDVVNHHHVRDNLRDFAARRKMYGGSAADLEIRHPRRLIPAQPSLSGLGVLTALSLKKPKIALVIAAYELVRHRAILDREMSMSVVAEATWKSLWSDFFWLGHLLRRDWWPIGFLVILCTPKSKLARGVAAAMAWEPVRDHILRPTRLDPVRSLILRAIDDASYGTGVITNAAKKRVANVVLPRVRIPWWPKKD